MEYKEDYIIFYTLKNDWKKRIRQIKYKDFDENTMDEYNINDDLLEKFNDMIKRADYGRIRVHFKNKPIFSRNSIKFQDFDPSKMDLIYVSKEKQEEINNEISKAIKEGKSPFRKIAKLENPKESSIFYNNKIDEGAVENFLDDKLEGAKKRAVERNKKYGGSFLKNNANKVKIPVGGF